MIEVENLNKSFNGTKILDNVSFSIKTGDIVAYLGPNGAGKTTTINILATLIEPDEGSILLNNYDLEKDSKKIRKIIGYVFEDFGLYPNLTVEKNLNFIGKLYKLSKESRRKKIEEQIRFFELKEYKTTQIAKLSKGSKQKVNIAKALLHDPEVLFLDEPTSGLDPFTAKNILHFVLSLKQEGKTILVTTHLLNRAEMISDEIILINKGKIIFKGKITEIEKINSLEDLYFTLLGDNNEHYSN